MEFYVAVFPHAHVLRVNTIRIEIILIYHINLSSTTAKALFLIHGHHKEGFNDAYYLLLLPQIHGTAE